VFFQVFLLQGALMMIIALPVVYSLRFINLPLFELNYPGIFLIIFGLIFETVADQQRYLFLKKERNKDQLISTGLWRYSRHPNYFGEIIFWWGIYFLVLGAPKSWMMIISPLTITYIMLFVSGLPMEERYRGRPDFEEYKRRTSALIPWFVKKNR
jgi:steroid 5-alpha reductase family enzyme